MQLMRGWVDGWVGVGGNEQWSIQPSFRMPPRLPACDASPCQSRHSREVEVWRVVGARPLALLLHRRRLRLGAAPEAAAAAAAAAASHAQLQLQPLVVCPQASQLLLQSSSGAVGGDINRHGFDAGAATPQIPCCPCCAATAAAAQRRGRRRGGHGPRWRPQRRRRRCCALPCCRRLAEHVVTQHRAQAVCQDGHASLQKGGTTRGGGGGGGLDGGGMQRPRAVLEPRMCATIHMELSRQGAG